MVIRTESDISVFPRWMSSLSMQQQSVLALSLRGPDGIRKYHPVKVILRAYRACVLKAAMYGRPMIVREVGDTFMTRHIFDNHGLWLKAIEDFFDTIDEMPLHYMLHLIHAIQILAEYHPELETRRKWGMFYAKIVDSFHMRPEPPEAMARRLSDWDRTHWHE